MKMKAIKDFTPKKLLKVRPEDSEWVEKYHIRNIDRVRTRMREEKKKLKHEMREKVF